MWSRMPSVARPVRIEAISCCKSARAFSMRVLTLASTSLTVTNVVAAGAAGGSGFIRMPPISIGLLDHCADGFAHRHTHYISTVVQIENDDRQLVIAAHRDGRGVHH